MKTHRMTKNKVHAIQCTGNNTNLIMAALIERRVASDITTATNEEGIIAPLLGDWLVFDAAGVRACDEHDFPRIYGKEKTA